MNLSVVGFDDKSNVAGAVVGLDIMKVASAVRRLVVAPMYEDDEQFLKLQNFHNRQNKTKF